MLVQVKRLEDQNLGLALQLETCTGRPASDWGSIPATPSDLTLPNQASPASEPEHVAGTKCGATSQEVAAKRK